MMRALASLVAIGGCASGGSGAQTDAGPGGQHDAQRDAAPVDGRPDARPVDARPIDAPPPPSDACVPAAIEHLANPALDLTPNGVGWTEVPIQGIPGGPYPIITGDGLAAQSPANKAWLGGSSGVDVTPQQFSVTDQMYQDFVIPTMTTQVVINGFYAVGTTEAAGSTVYDTFSLDVIQTNGTPIEAVLALSNTMPINTWTPFTKTLVANLSGMTVRLRATSTNDITYHSNFFLDTLSLRATHCP